VQIAHNRLLKSLLGASDVGIFDAQHETPVSVTGKEVVEQGCARRTNV
jgi:hypothetical protein